VFLTANPTLVAIVAGVVVIGVLIFVHELGHFVAAKAVGIAVLRFSFGLGPRTPIGIKVGETDYCLSWIPFGGFVKMAGIEEFEDGAAGAMEGNLAAQGAQVPRERTFDAKPLWARIVVILAGVAMNAAFALLLYFVVARAWGEAYDPTVTVAAVDSTAIPFGAAALRTLRPGDRIERVNGRPVTTWGEVQDGLLSGSGPGGGITIEVAGRGAPLLVDVGRSEAARESLVVAIEPAHAAVVGEVSPGAPAAKAGLLEGDTIVAAGGAPVASWEAMVGVIEKSAGRPLGLEVRRDGRTLALEVTPQATPVTDVDGSRRTVGRVGITLHYPVRRLGWWAAAGAGLRQTGRSAGLILFTIKGMFTGQVSVRDLGGPIAVGQISGEVVRLGLDAFLSFIALFSINLAILNLLPIPVLDGGHVVFLVIEGVRGRPLSLEQRQRATQIGFFILVGIMALALGNDFLRLFR